MKFYNTDKPTRAHSAPFFCQRAETACHPGASRHRHGLALTLGLLMLWFTTLPVAAATIVVNSKADTTVTD